MLRRRSKKLASLNSKNILFIINGLGLGNSTRCDAIIDELILLGYQIDLCTSGNGLRYFAKDLRIRRLFKQRQISYPLRDGKIHWRRLCFEIPRWAHAFQGNIRQIKSILSQNKYGGIVIDSDYCAAFIPRHRTGPVFAINNSDVLIKNRSALKKLTLKHYPQLGIEALDYLFHYLRPDNVISPSLTRKAYLKGRYLHVTPVVRERKMQRAVGDKGALRIVVLCGGSQLSSSFSNVTQLKGNAKFHVDILGIEGKRNDNIYYHKFTNSLKFIAQADVLVMNGGASSVGEALVYRKPCVVIPIEGHAEQYANALQIQDLGLGLVATEANWTTQLLTLIDGLRTFRKCHKDFDLKTKGARMVAQFIHERMFTPLF